MVSDYFQKLIQKQKERVLADWGGQCEMCTEKDVPVDVYLRFADEADPYGSDDQFIVLCPWCHVDHLKYLKDAEDA